MTVGIVIGSTRPGRVGGQIGAWVAGRAGASGDLIDLAEQGLPLLDEPEHASTGNYARAHTQRWSERIAGCAALVFVTPEYNSSFPASLKNALDFLYHEWHGKPVGVVAYGGVSSGGRAAQSLLPVLVHLGMMPVGTLLVRFRDYLADSRFVPSDALDVGADDLFATLRRATSPVVPVSSPAS